jgi:pimeloyl-ACP methyl ester carboxylesterase
VKTVRLGTDSAVELCLDTFGSPADPAVLLIQGMSGSMLWWEEDFCARIAAGGRFVIRYDHRDTGASVSYPPGRPGYTGADLGGDAVGILDALGVPAATVAGISMGGAIAQLIALDRPERVTALVLIATTAGGDDLPGMAPRLRAHYAELTPPDYTDRDAVIAHLLAEHRVHAGSHPFDEAAVRELIARDVDRTVNIESAMTNHALAESGGSWRSRLGSITAPTVVLHGTEDPLFPYPHGEALARAIPGARLVPMPGAGHEVPRAVWDVVIPAILDVSG